MRPPITHANGHITQQWRSPLLTLCASLLTPRAPRHDIRHPQWARIRQQKPPVLTPDAPFLTFPAFSEQHRRARSARSSRFLTLDAPSTNIIRPIPTPFSTPDAPFADMVKPSLTRGGAFCDTRGTLLTRMGAVGHAGAPFDTRGPLFQAHEDIARLMREECAGLSRSDIRHPLPISVLSSF